MARLTAVDCIWGEDLDVIMQLIEEGDFEDEEFNRDINGAIEDMVSVEETFTCDLCHKVCKTKAGLTRHKKVKHPQQAVPATGTTSNPAIHNLQLKLIIEKAAKKLTSDTCYSCENREKFKNFEISTDESLEVWHSFNRIFENYNGNAERFYSQFYYLMLPGKHVFTQLPLQLSTLLCGVVADLSLLKLSSGQEGQQNVNVEEIKPSLTKKDIHCIEYLAGYCFRTLFFRIRRSKNWESKVSK